MGFIGVFSFLLFQSISVTPETDPLYLARDLVLEKGMKAARDELPRLLFEVDSSRGDAAKRLEAIVDEPGPLSDSMIRMTQPERHKVVFAFINGLAQGPKSRPTLATIRELRTHGYRAYYLPSDAHGSEMVNGEYIASWLSHLKENYDHLIVVAGSKGTRDLLRALIDRRTQLSPYVIQRLRVVVSFSGIIRESIPARWFLKSRSMMARLMRTILFFPGLGKLRKQESLRLIQSDPWTHYKPWDFEVAALPTWINFVALPEGSDGFPKTPWPLKRSERTMLKEGYVFGPHDGLVEVAGQVLPPALGFRQWILPVVGDHSFQRGSLLNGRQLIPDQFEDETDELFALKTGALMADRILRFIPHHLLQSHGSACPTRLSDLAL